MGKRSVRHEGSKASSRWSEDDLHLFGEGSHSRLYDKLGAHVLDSPNAGTMFSVWAPNAAAVSVIGDFNLWRIDANALRPRGSSGIWEGFIPDVGAGARYKYHIHSRTGGYKVNKADPVAFYAEVPPATASVVWDLSYAWKDSDWMASRREHNALDAPISTYELHLGSWMRDPRNPSRILSYREIAPRLADYIEELGFTHVELLPVMEHPFYGSWGYQVTGYYAATSRYGTPQDLMFLIDTLHQRGIGVFLDWVPSHFPRDEHGLAFFDGTHLYEHEDPRRGLHPDWDSLIFNYGRSEVPGFLVSNAMFWLDKYHADGLRVDAVASMLYLDYSRREGEWIPNVHGGRENLEAIAFLRRLNETVYREYPDVQVIAEESTSWPMVSHPIYAGGLGFGMKWDMGWMHDMLQYMAKDPIHRRYHQNLLTFRMLYAFHENFVLSLSHDEVVHGKESLIGKMDGDEWRRFANLRLLYGYMMGQSGKKLLFMGGEFGQWSEWDHDSSLDWDLLQWEPHSKLKQWISDLNRLYRNTEALYGRDFDASGFEWIDCSDADAGVVSLIRHGASDQSQMVVVGNFTPVTRAGYRVGVPCGGFWREVLNSDADVYGGSGVGNLGGLVAEPISMHGRAHSLLLTLPPLAILFLQAETGNSSGDNAKLAANQGKTSDVARRRTR